jgi:hypothetical protein
MPSVARELPLDQATDLPLYSNEDDAALCPVLSARPRTESASADCPVALHLVQEQAMARRPHAALTAAFKPGRTSGRLPHGPIILSNRKPLATLRGAVLYITQLPKDEHDAASTIRRLSGADSLRRSDSIRNSCGTSEIRNYGSAKLGIRLQLAQSCAQSPASENGFFWMQRQGAKKATEISECAQRPKSGK